MDAVILPGIIQSTIERSKHSGEEPEPEIQPASTTEKTWIWKGADLTLAGSSVGSKVQ